jgi:hypothetical protein
MVQWFGEHADEGNLVTITVPTIGHMTYHKRMAEAARQVWIAIDQAGLGHLIDMTDYRASGGTYNNRPVTGGSSPSPHAWGVATDVNTNHIMAHGLEVTVDSNYHCHPDQVADSLKAFAPFFYWWGFSWGGRWHSFLDPMHFEATEITVALLEGYHIPDAFAKFRAGLGVVPQPPIAVIGPHGPIDCDAHLGNGQTRALLRPVMNALGFVTVDHIPDLRQVDILPAGSPAPSPQGHDYHPGPVTVLDGKAGITIECNAVLEAQGVRVDLADVVKQLGGTIAWDGASHTATIAGP